MAKSNKTQNQKEFELELKRIRRAVKKLKAQGYSLPYETKVIGRTNYQRYTKQAVERLKKITPSVLRESASIIDPETGDIISGTEYYKKQLSERAKKAAKTRREKERAKGNLNFQIKAFLKDQLESIVNAENESDKTPHGIAGTIADVIDKADTNWLVEIQTDIMSEITYITSLYASERAWQEIKPATDDLIRIILSGGGTSVEEAKQFMEEYRNEDEAFESYD